jgi:hypothetical protein
VASVSFTKELTFATFTATADDTVVFPPPSRAIAVSVCAPFETVRVSQERP